MMRQVPRRRIARLIAKLDGHDVNAGQPCAACERDTQAFIKTLRAQGYEGMRLPPRRWRWDGIVAVLVNP
jgi:hypothetical protein